MAIRHDRIISVGIKPTGTLHRGREDTTNIAQLQQYLWRHQGIGVLEKHW